MKNDIKKKFIDILFEPDEDDEVYEKPVEEKKKPVKKQENTVKAKDILYRKPEKSAFIDLNEKKKKEDQQKKAEEVYGDYEFSSQISPIFGVIKENKPEFKSSVSANESLVNKPDSSHLEIITSPIYGYGTRDDYIKDNLDFNHVLEDTDEEELHRLLDDDLDFGSHTYDDFDEDEELNLFNDLEEEE